MNSSSISVSACIICYNQEKFIQQTLEGAFLQKTDFNYEIVIADDCSVDTTAEVIRKNVSEYEGNANIRILNTEVNVGMHGNWERAIAACNGKYIALCEGDDLWQDKEKLQKQVGLLEQNPYAVACFSNAEVLKDDGTAGKYPYVDKDIGNLKAKDFFSLNSNPIPTCTIVFRRSAFKGFPPEYYKSPFADWILHSLLIQKGNYIHLSDITSSYRQHDGGVWSGIEEEKQLLSKWKALRLIGRIIDGEYRADNRRAISDQLDQLLYFYRKEKSSMKFLRTWLKLKSLRKGT